MAAEQVEALVIGAGQAGIAASEHLGKARIPHLVLERARIAERWHSERWDSLVTNGPVWHDRFPGMEFPQTPPDGFAPKEEVAQYLADYARMIAAPIRTGVNVTQLSREPGHAGFLVKTSAGDFRADHVIAATGPFQKPVIPPLVPQRQGLMQLHSAGYRNPEALPPGAVLVIGAGSSGVQIAEELAAAGRRVFLSVGPHDRPPRRYRGRDFVWWLGVLGKWDAAAPHAGTEHVTIAVSGANGGHTIDFRRLAAKGITLLGQAEGLTGNEMRFKNDLAANIARGDANYLALLDEADAYVRSFGLDLPEDPDARVFGPDPDCVTRPILSLDLGREDIHTLLWATGYAQDYSWIDLDVFDERGRPRHQRGASPEPGLYFLGLPWQSRRGSSFLWGVWHDARHVVDLIAIQRNYRDYRPDGGR
jgi:putative flavoprotein involved in K+ transport